MFWTIATTHITHTPLNVSHITSLLQRHHIWTSCMMLLKSQFDWLSCLFIPTYRNNSTPDMTVCVAVVCCCVGIICFGISMVTWFSFKDEWPYILKILDISLLEVLAVLWNLIWRIVPLFIFYSNEGFANLYSYQWYYVTAFFVGTFILTLLGCMCFCTVCCTSRSERLRASQGYITLNDLSSRHSTNNVWLKSLDDCVVWSVVDGESWLWCDVVKQCRGQCICGCCVSFTV